MVEEVLSSEDNVFQTSFSFYQVIQVEAEHSSQHHVGETGGHGEGLVVSLFRQVDIEGVVACSSSF